MSERDDGNVWLCPECGLRNSTRARCCERCGKADEAEPSSPGRKVKLRFLDFGERVRAALRPPQPRRRGRSRPGGASPFVLLIAFVVWGVVRLVGYYPLLLLLKFVAFLFTPLGLPVWLLMAWYYSQHRKAIHRTLQGVLERLQMLASMAAKVLESVSLLRGGVASLLGREEDETRRGGGSAARRTAVRILEEEWDDDDDEGDDEPLPPPRRQR